ncbi:hypothetical protein ACTXT7_015215 [Hymenolepis weldensis]
MRYTESLVGAESLESLASATELNSIRKDLFSSPSNESQYPHPNPQTWTRMLEEISSDKGFKCPLVEFAQALVSSNRGSQNRLSLRNATPRTYFYEFAHRTESLPWPRWMKTMHGQEIEYIFGALFSPLFMNKFYGFTKPEMDLADIMMTYWANFARTGSQARTLGGRKLIGQYRNTYLHCCNVELVHMEKRKVYKMYER